MYGWWAACLVCSLSLVVEIPRLRGVIGGPARSPADDQEYNGEQHEGENHDDDGGDDEGTRIKLTNMKMAKWMARGWE